MVKDNWREREEREGEGKVSPPEKV